MNLNLAQLLNRFGRSGAQPLQRPFGRGGLVRGESGFRALYEFGHAQMDLAAFWMVYGKVRPKGHSRLTHAKMEMPC